MLLIRRIQWGEPEQLGQPFPTKLIGIVVPDCCEAVRQSLAVTLQYRWGDMSDLPAACARAPEGLDWSQQWDPKTRTTKPSSMQLWLDTLPEAERELTRFDVATPRWVVGLSVDSKHQRRLVDECEDPAWETPEPSFCPHCGTELPVVERAPVDELPGPVHRPVGDGDYCGTCGERSRECSCMFPAAAWRTVREDGQTLVRELRPDIPVIEGEWPYTVGKLLRTEHVRYGSQEARHVFGNDYYMQPHVFPPGVYVMSGTAMTEGPHAFWIKDEAGLSERFQEEVLVVDPWEGCSLAPYLGTPSDPSPYRPEWVILTKDVPSLVSEVSRAGIVVWVDDQDPNTTKRTPDYLEHLPPDADETEELGEDVSTLIIEE